MAESVIRLQYFSCREGVRLAAVPCVLRAWRDRLSRARRHQRGFTVIELGIVLLLVTILTLVAGSSYRANIMRSKLVECITHIQYLRRLALDHFYNEGQYPTPENFLKTYGDDPALTAFNYTILSTGGPKGCNASDTDKGHGNDCDRRDEDNPGRSTGSSGPLKVNGDRVPVGGDLLRTGVLAGTALRYGFEIVCTHDHFPIAEYVYANSLIPNAIVVQMTPTAAPAP